MIRSGRLRRGGVLPQALLVLFSVPCAAMGSIWLLWALDFNTSVAVWVGLIGLLVYIVVIVSLAAGVTWIVVKLSPSKSQKQLEARQQKQAEAG